MHELPLIQDMCHVDRCKWWRHVPSYMATSNRHSREPELFARSSVETTQRIARELGVSEAVVRGHAATIGVPKLGPAFCWSNADLLALIELLMLENRLAAAEAAADDEAEDDDEADDEDEDEDEADDEDDAADEDDDAADEDEDDEDEEADLEDA